MALNLVQTTVRWTSIRGVQSLALGPFWIAAATVIGRATGMPLSDARETVQMPLVPRVAGGRRTSETTQCARNHSVASQLGIGQQSARSALEQCRVPPRKTPAAIPPVGGKADGPSQWAVDADGQRTDTDLDAHVSTGLEQRVLEVLKENRQARRSSGHRVRRPDGRVRAALRVEPSRYASIDFAELRRFAGRVTYETVSDPINAAGSKDKAPSPAR
jgi:hypothetical protein